MADGRHFKIVFFLLYLSRESSDFNEIWYADANFGSNNSHVAKYQIFANPSEFMNVPIFPLPIYNE